MKIIKLVVFNETYWDKGLIYSQNLLPLLKLSKDTGAKIELISFTSIVMMLFKRRDIRHTKERLNKQGVRVINFPVLFYPTRYMLLRVWLIPFYFMNVFMYIKWLERNDINQDVIYNIRSYQAALGFYKFYKNKKRIVFDLRTDWIEENINRGLFSSNSLTAKYWYKHEKEMLNQFSKSLFISPEFMRNVLSRHNITFEISKFYVIYNPIDYKHFNIKDNERGKCDFIYTGSLGHWNKLENYLDFFQQLSSDFNNEKLIVCTNSPRSKVEKIIAEKQYSDIRNKIQVFYNVSYKDLPFIYSKCRYGLQIMNKKDSRVGVKVIEYVAAGIVPIVHENVQGAANLLKSTGIGIVFNDTDLSEKSEFVARLKSLEEIDINSNEYKKFKSLTDLNEISKQLIKIYES